MDVDTERAPLVRASMSEILTTPQNGLVAAGSYSGCGGGALGLRWAGWEVPAAIEFVPAAAECYRANLPATHILQKDIRQVKVGEVLDALEMTPGELDLWEGSPPCASFSHVGMRGRDWGKPKAYSEGMVQRTDDLFWEWIRLLRGLRPRALLAENVPGLVTGPALEEYARRITQEIADCGYRVAARIVNAAHFGVPQVRRRLILLGYREDLGLHPRFPDPLPGWPPTLRQALASVDPLDPDHGPFLEASSMEGFATGRTWEWRQGLRDKALCARCELPLVDHATVMTSTSRVRRVEGAGGERRPLTSVVCADGGRGVEIKNYSMLMIPDLDDPCYTITAMDSNPADASVCHPTECRKFTPAECKAIAGFPPDFVLTGSREQRMERIGRAVVPPVYRAFGERIARALREGY